jgi:hypothetical protein
MGSSVKWKVGSGSMPVHKTDLKSKLLADNYGILLCVQGRPDLSLEADTPEKMFNVSFRSLCSQFSWLNKYLAYTYIFVFLFYSTIQCNISFFMWYRTLLLRLREQIILLLSRKVGLRLGRSRTWACQTASSYDTLLHFALSLYLFSVCLKLTLCLWSRELNYDPVFSSSDDLFRIRSPACSWSTLDALLI